MQMRVRLIQPLLRSCRLIHQLSRSLKAGKQLFLQVMPIRQKTLQLERLLRRKRVVRMQQQSQPIKRLIRKIKPQQMLKRPNRKKTNSQQRRKLLRKNSLPQRLQISSQASILIWQKPRETKMEFGKSGNKVFIVMPEAKVIVSFTLKVRARILFTQRM